MAEIPDARDDDFETGARPPPIFVADHLALDFVNTRAFPGGKEVEWLADGRDLLAWLATAKLTDPTVLKTAAAEFGAARLDAAARQARELREWLRGFVERHAGRPLGPSAANELRPLNDLLTHDNTFRSLGAGASTRIARETSALIWHRHRRKLPPAATLLLPVADAIGDLLTGEDFALVGQCEGTGCSLVFLDRTKNHRRRWCSIAWCGNRAKAAAHRARKKADTNARSSRRD
jgi:predicted RNA-binding Zn ribbon-like protein